MAENVRDQGKKTVPLTPAAGGFEVLPARVSRFGMIIQNRGVNTVYLKFGDDDFTDTVAALELLPDAVLILTGPPADKIYGKADTADNDVYAVHW